MSIYITNVYLGYITNVVPLHDDYSEALLAQAWSNRKVLNSLQKEQDCRSRGENAGQTEGYSQKRNTIEKCQFYCLLAVLARGTTESFVEQTEIQIKRQIET